jgi:hypothetical protein
MANSGSATLDFGAFPGSNEASVVITGEAGIVTGSRVDAWIVVAASSNHTENDHAYAASLVGVSAGTIVNATGFTIHARSAEKMQGVFNVNWAWV